LPVKIETVWKNLPGGVRDHILARVKDREITLAQLAEFQKWMATAPGAPSDQESPNGWYKRFSTFVVASSGRFCKTFLSSRDAAVIGTDLDTYRPY